MNVVKEGHSECLQDPIYILVNMANCGADLFYSLIMHPDLFYYPLNSNLDSKSLPSLDKGGGDYIKIVNGNGL